MGFPKADLPFGEQTMLTRVVSILGEVVEPILVVAAREQNLPDLDAQVVRDRREAQGPLEGIVTGLSALAGGTMAAFVTSCDVPFLQPEVIRYLIDSLDDHEIVVPNDQTHCHPLVAVYRTSVLAPAQELLRANRLRPTFLLDIVDTIEVSVDQLRPFDPDLQSLANLNTPEDYVAALRAAGLELPEHIRLRG